MIDFTGIKNDSNNIQFIPQQSFGSFIEESNVISINFNDNHQTHNQNELSVTINSKYHNRSQFNLINHGPNCSFSLIHTNLA